MEHEINRSRYIVQLEKSVCREVAQRQQKLRRSRAKRQPQGIRQLLTMVGLVH